MTELGFEVNQSDTSLLGAYDHIYEDNFKTRHGINTHYVALGYKIVVPNEIVVNCDSQHSSIKWWTAKDLLNSESVHANTKKYFKSL